MRAKFIYEKFVEDSDPIKDLGIGLEKKYEKYILYRIPIVMSDENELKLLNFFNVKSFKNIYWLGDTAINNDYEKTIYFDKLNKFISHNAIHKKPLMNTLFLFRKFNMRDVLRCFETPIGKIATLEYREGYSRFICVSYFGDLQIIAHIDPISYKIVEDL